MENKINIAKLLKDCPKGMELDCTMFDCVFLEGVMDDDDYPILIKTKYGHTCNLTSKGCWGDSPSAECVIFPKGKTSWEGFHRPPFKNGDIAISNRGDIHLLRTEDSSYCAYRERFIGSPKFDSTITTSVRVVRFATEEEKQKLFDAIKDNGYKWNAETKSLEKLVAPKFKAEDKVMKNKILELLREMTNDSKSISYKAEKMRLKILGRKLSRKVKGSKAFDITKQRIAKVHSRVARKRLDYLHKITHRLTHENQVSTICVENLNVKGMVRNKHLAYDISDAGIGKFYTMLAYKCDWYGINLVKIGRFQPSSKRCSCCGYINKTLTLSVRNWTCPECGESHDRDRNASVNIRNFGLATLRMERPEVKPVECPLVDDRASAPKKQWYVEKGKTISKCNLEAHKSLT